MFNQQVIVGIKQTELKSFKKSVCAIDMLVKHLKINKI